MSAFDNASLNSHIIRRFRHISDRIHGVDTGAHFHRCRRKKKYSDQSEHSRLVVHPEPRHQLVNFVILANTTFIDRISVSCERESPIHILLTSSYSYFVHWKPFNALPSQTLASHRSLRPLNRANKPPSLPSSSLTLSTERKHVQNNLRFGSRSSQLGGQGHVHHRRRRRVRYHWLHRRAPGRREDPEARRRQECHGAVLEGMLTLPEGWRFGLSTDVSCDCSTTTRAC